MNKRINITIADSFVYTLVMIIANIAGTVGLIASLIIVRTLVGVQAFYSIHGDEWLWFVPFILLISFVAETVSILVTRFYFSYKIPDILPRGEDALEGKNIWGSFSFLVLPAEILRLIMAILCSKPGRMFGYRLFDGVLTIVPNFLFDQFYITPAGRLDGIRDAGYTVGENFIYLGINLVYFAIVIGALYFVFSRVWKNSVNARSKEVKLRMDPEQMK